MSQKDVFVVYSWSWFLSAISRSTNESWCCDDFDNVSATEDRSTGLMIDVSNGDGERHDRLT